MPSGASCRDASAAPQDHWAPSLWPRLIWPHAISRGIYGAPRVRAELRAEGRPLGRKRIVRLMREAGLAGVSRRKGTRTTRREPEARPTRHPVGADQDHPHTLTPLHPYTLTPLHPHTYTPTPTPPHLHPHTYTPTAPFGCGQLGFGTFSGLRHGASYTAPRAGSGGPAPPCASGPLAEATPPERPPGLRNASRRHGRAMLPLSEKPVRRHQLRDGRPGRGKHVVRRPRGGGAHRPYSSWQENISTTAAALDAALRPGPSRRFPQQQLQQAQQLPHLAAAAAVPGR